MLGTRLADPRRGVGAEDRQVELGQGTVVCHHQLLDPAAIPVGPDEVNRPRRGAISADPAGEQDPHPVLLGVRSEEHTSELQSLMRISYAVFSLQKTTSTAQPNKQERQPP